MKKNLFVILAIVLIAGCVQQPSAESSESDAVPEAFVKIEENDKVTTYLILPGKNEPRPNVNIHKFSIVKNYHQPSEVSKELDVVFRSVELPVLVSCEFDKTLFANETYYSDVYLSGEVVHVGSSTEKWVDFKVPSKISVTRDAICADQPETEP